MIQLVRNECIEEEYIDIDKIKDISSFELICNNRIKAQFIYNPNTSTDSVGGFIIINRVDEELLNIINNQIHMNFYFICGDKIRGDVYALEQMKEAVGFDNLFLKENVTVHKSIIVKLNINYGRNLFVEKIHRDQRMNEMFNEYLHKDLRSFNDLVKKNGDIILQRKDSNNNNNEYRVYKSMLISSSPVFENMFKHDTQEKQTNIVKIQCKNEKIIESFIYFLSTKQLPGDINETELFELFKVAHCYQVKLLLFICLHQLADNVNKQSVIPLINLFDQYPIDYTELTHNIFVKIHIWMQKSGVVHEINLKSLPFMVRYMLINSNGN